MTARHQVALATERPFPGLVELDAAALARGALEVAEAALGQAGPVQGVGITNQRGTTVVWEAATGEPIGPALSWQDLRTAGTCLEMQGEGVRLAPNESVTKLAWLLDNFDANRSRDLRFGTLDTWVAWHLTKGSAHVTDYSNAAITGLLPTEDVLADRAALEWSTARLDRFKIPSSCLPLIVPSTGPVAAATALPGAPMLCAMVGDQQASLIGQGALEPGMAKATFGTGAFLDVNIGHAPPAFGARAKSGEHGCLPIIAWAQGQELTWGVEAVMLSAGTAITWLVEDLALVRSPQACAEVAAECADTDDVFFVPALVGLGTPQWDFGARSLFIGMTSGVGRPQMVRAVLRGIAHRGADLLDAAEADSGCHVEALRADGGMTANPVFLQELADAIGRPVEVSAELEATSLGAGLLAGLGSGTWAGWDQAAAVVRPRLTMEPAGPSRRERWREALSRCERWVPELSALKF